MRQRSEVRGQMSVRPGHGPKADGSIDLLRIDSSSHPLLRVVLIFLRWIGAVRRRSPRPTAVCAGKATLAAARGERDIFGASLLKKQFVRSIKVARGSATATTYCQLPSYFRQSNSTYFRCDRSETKSLITRTWCPGELPSAFTKRAYYPR